MKPFHRNCPLCKRTIKYKSRQSSYYARRYNVLCENCRPQSNYKGRDKQLTRECPSCQTIIQYTRFTNVRLAEQAQSLCKTCRHKKRTNVKKFKRKCPSCKDYIFYAYKSDKNVANKNSAKCRRCSGKEAYKNRKNKRSGGICKNYTINGVKCQGTWEKRYIENLCKKNKKLPSKINKPINTPYGLYLPDFEFSERYIEIKSPYTFDVARGHKAWHNQTHKSNKQIRKIAWTNENIKPVHTLILDRKGHLLEEITNYSIFNLESVT